MPSAITSSSSTIRTFVTRYSTLVSRSEYEELRAAFTASVSHELRIEDETLLLPLRRRMLRTIVENLFENAIRYAGEGATCTLSLCREDGAVVLEASDDGTGVPEEDAPRLFERFFRSDRARTT